MPASFEKFKTDQDRRNYKLSEHTYNPFTFYYWGDLWQSIVREFRGFVWSSAGEDERKNLAYEPKLLTESTRKDTSKLGMGSHPVDVDVAFGVGKLNWFRVGLHRVSQFISLCFFLFVAFPINLVKRVFTSIIDLLTFPRAKSKKATLLEGGPQKKHYVYHEDDRADGSFECEKDIYGNKHNVYKSPGPAFVIKLIVQKIIAFFTTFLAYVVASVLDLTNENAMAKATFLFVALTGLFVIAAATGALFSMGLSVALSVIFGLLAYKAITEWMSEREQFPKQVWVAQIALSEEGQVEGVAQRQQMLRTKWIPQGEYAEYELAKGDGKDRDISIYTSLLSDGGALVYLPMLDNNKKPTGKFTLHQLKENHCIDGTCFGLTDVNVSLSHGKVEVRFKEDAMPDFIRRGKSEEVAKVDFGALSLCSGGPPVAAAASPAAAEG